MNRGEPTFTAEAVAAHALPDGGHEGSQHGGPNDSGYWSGLEHVRERCAAAGDDVERLVTRDATSGLLTVRSRVPEGLKGPSRVRAWQQGVVCPARQRPLQGLR
jgi:hypothetical protein